MGHQTRHPKITIEEAKARLRELANCEPDLRLVKSHPYATVLAAFAVGAISGYSPRARKILAHILKEIM